MMGKPCLLYPQDGKVRVTSPFGMRNGRMHRGVDVASDNKGIDWNLAAGDGRVTRVGYQESGAGHWIEIALSFPIDGKNAFIRYYHLKEAPRFYSRTGVPHAKVGNVVFQGEKIGVEGNTGTSFGDHLHFELRLGSTDSANAVDPVPYLWIPKKLPIDGGKTTQQQFATVRYFEDFKEEDMLIKRGAKGEVVKALQAAVEELGYSVGKNGVDGSFGGDTESAFKAMQKAAKIEVTGEVDDATLAYLVTGILKNPRLTSAKKLTKEFSDKISKL